MEIVKAKEQDINHLLDITQACAKHMISTGIYQWNEQYPNRAAFEQDIHMGQLYVLKNEDQIKGCIVVSTIMDEEYKEIDWLTPDDHNIYIHRLAVHPDSQGKGYAQQLMDFAETYAQRNKFASVRLDTFSQNPRNNRFYQKRGYQQLGDVFFPKQSEHPFHCYELVINE
ncbi:MAG: GNAT family N-acetyltransferase [Flavobacteriaceae bacterium]|nr:GNAT family N-acetyltransferase [Flavobacteriaceae bacterium]